MLRTVQDELLKRISEHGFFCMVGVTSCSVAQDALHILFANGVLSHLFGSYLHTLCYVNKSTAPPAAYTMGIVAQRVQELYGN